MLSSTGALIDVNSMSCHIMKRPYHWTLPKKVVVFSFLGVCLADESFTDRKEGEIGHLYHSFKKL